MRRLRPSERIPSEERPDLVGMNRFVGGVVVFNPRTAMATDRLSKGAKRISKACSAPIAAGTLALAVEAITVGCSSRNGK